MAISQAHVFYLPNDPNNTWFDLRKVIKVCDTSGGNVQVWLHGMGDQMPPYVVNKTVFEAAKTTSLAATGG